MKKTLIICMLSLLITSCGKSDMSEVPPLSNQSEKKNFKSSFDYDGELLKNEASILLKDFDDQIRVTLDPYEYQEVSRKYQKTAGAYHTMGNKPLGFECNVDWHVVSDVRSTTNIPSTILSSHLKFIKLDSEVKDYSKNLRFKIENSLIIIEINNAHFKARELTLLNPTIKRIPKYQYNISECLQYEGGRYYGNILNFSHESAGNQYVSFHYQVL